MSEAPDEILLELRGLEVGYGGQAILPPIDAQLRRGEFWALIGRNGSGKTTLLRTMLGLQPKVRGAIVRAPAAAVGYAPQREAIDPSVPMRVIDLVRSGVDRGWRFLVPGALWRTRREVARALRETDLTQLARRQYTTLSEGQKQRVLMARVLAGQPSLFVLDEPTSAMDLVAEREAFALIDRLRVERNLAVLVVSHHLSVVAERASHVMMVDTDAVVAGSVREAVADPRFVDHYGTVFAPHAAAAQEGAS